MLKGHITFTDYYEGTNSNNFKNGAFLKSLTGDLQGSVAGGADTDIILLLVQLVHLRPHEGSIRFIEFLCQSGYSPVITYHFFSFFSDLISDCNHARFQ